MVHSQFWFTPFKKELRESHRICFQRSSSSAFALLNWFIQTLAWFIPKHPLFFLVVLVFALR